MGVRQTRQVTHEGKKSLNRMYKILIENNKQECLLSKIEEVSKLWHSRLGHVNYQAMSLLFKNKMVYGMPKVFQPKDTCMFDVKTNQEAIFYSNQLQCFEGT